MNEKNKIDELNKGDTEKKMTLEEYESKYTKRQNTKAIRSFLFIFTAGIGVLIGFCLTLLCLRVFELNEIAGYVSIAVAVLIFIILYVVPVARIRGMKSFETNVNAYNAKSAKKHNKKLRGEIADNMIHFTAKTEGVGWYDSSLIGKLAIARQTGNDSELKAALSEIYDKDVKKSANSIIYQHALKTGIATALSQSDKIDTLFVTFYELNLIKELVFLYGYRPSEAKLVRIYGAVLRNALIAYGLQSAAEGITTSILSKIGNSVKGIPLLGSALSTVIGSASQGIINGTLTVVIGFQTKKYLQKEYRLSEILDDVDTGTDEGSEKEMMIEVKDELSKKIKKPEKEKSEAVE